jgi:hypothetical protein
MNDSFFNDTNQKWFKIIDGLMVSNEDVFFNTLYMAITNHPSYVITSDLENDRKDTILGAMLKHFENKEEFEKCACIFNIKKQIKLTC